MIRLIRMSLAAWERWRWKRQKRAPRSILKKQERLQAERRKHRATREVMKEIYAERHALLRKEQNKRMAR